MMSVQNVRIILLAALIVVGMLLYNNWQKKEALAANLLPQVAATKGSSPNQVQNQTIAPGIGANEIPTPSKVNAAAGNAVKETAGGSEKNRPASEAAAPQNTLITVKTDVFNIGINPLGGDITYTSLPSYAEEENEDPKQHPYILMDESQKRYYIAQSGLSGEQGPDRSGVGRAKFTSSSSNYQLEQGQNRLVVDLKTNDVNGVDITKRYTFNRGSYIIELEYLIDNHSNTPYRASFYGRLKRRPTQSGGGFLGVQTYTGAAIFTPGNHYKKISFKDIEEKLFSEEIEGGWVAMVEHYFITAWVPEPNIRYDYHTARLSDGTDAIGFVAPATNVAPGAADIIKARLFAGPQTTEVLGQISPGLELSVDYGILWPICQPLFWLLKQIYDVVGNWGWAIVIITIIIKALFYKLSASSYRSMGNMRKLQPRIEALKERYGDDKQKFSQAVMELYKKEKVNPLGGCLPIIIQIPVFIALYYVLLGSVELRQAPFILWIHDLSAKDPFYILPILMGLSMLLQQKLNPPPPDPVQAKVMMLMPVIFTVLFLNFPSGLVLYWFVNNVLSIAQQWYIMRNMNGSASHGAKQAPSKA